MTVQELHDYLGARLADGVNPDLTVHVIGIEVSDVNMSFRI